MARQPNYMAIMLVALMTNVIAGCDVSESLGRSTDTTKPSLTNNGPTQPLLADEPLEIHFSESMDTESVKITESSLEVGSYEEVWRDSDRILSLKPILNWPAGPHSLQISARDKSGLYMVEAETVTFNANLSFNSFHEASEVSPSLLGGSRVSGSYQHFQSIWFADYEGDSLKYFASFPKASNQLPVVVPIDSMQYREDDDSVTSFDFSGPVSPIVSNQRMIVANAKSHQVFAFNGVPEGGKENYGVALGDGSGTCSPLSFNEPAMAIISNDKFYVVDSSNNRILIWHQVPTQNTPADLVIGQNSLSNCMLNDDDQNGVADNLPSARTLNKPTAVWANEQKLLVLDSGNNRVLGWNMLPDENFKEADFVLGREDFLDDAIITQPTERTLMNPSMGLASNGRQIFVSDTDAHRVMIWNDWPSENYQAADQVIGHSDFSKSTENDEDEDGNANGATSVKTFHSPMNINLQNNQFLITDSGNGRVMLFKSL